MNPCLVSDLISTNNHFAYLSSNFGPRGGRNEQANNVFGGVVHNTKNCLHARHMSQFRQFLTLPKHTACVCPSGREKIPSVKKQCRMAVRPQANWTMQVALEVVEEVVGAEQAAMVAEEEDHIGKHV